MKKAFVLVVIFAGLIYYFKKEDIKSGCIFGTFGDGNIISETRLYNPFDGLIVSEGIQAELILSDEFKAVISIDSNLLDHISTEIDKENNLRISYDKNVCGSNPKVMVYANDLSFVKTSSGANLKCLDTLKVNVLEVKSSSGSHLQIGYSGDSLFAQTSSGGSLYLSGSSEFGEFEASSGAFLGGGKLNCIDAQADVSSGASVELSIENSLDAEASSGGSISYLTDSATIYESISSGGSIRLKD